MSEVLLPSLEDKMKEAVGSASRRVKEVQDSRVKHLILKTRLKEITDLGGFPKKVVRDDLNSSGWIFSTYSMMLKL